MRTAWVSTAGLQIDIDADVFTVLEGRHLYSLGLGPVEAHLPQVNIRPRLDRDKLLEVLGKLTEEDPTFRVSEDTDTGDTLISGMGELHLEIIADRLQREFKIDVRLGKPQVLLMETTTIYGLTVRIRSA